MPPVHVFVSYAHEDRVWCERLLAHLGGLRESREISLFDDSQLAPGEWERQLQVELDRAHIVVLILSAHFGASRFCSAFEMRRALERFEDGSCVVLPVLAEHCDWEALPINQFQIYPRNEQRVLVPLTDWSDANRPLAEVARIVRQEVSRLETQQVELVVGEHDMSTPGVPAARVDVSRLIRLGAASATDFVGRDVELRRLGDAWLAATMNAVPRAHVVSIVGLGGEGKTSLVMEWISELARREWEGCEAVFAWSFYSQDDIQDEAVSSDLFLTQALVFFGEAEFAYSRARSYEKGRHLAHVVGRRRALLFLDGIEPLQAGPLSPTPGALKDPGLSGLLAGLAAQSWGLCVVNSRYAVAELRRFLTSTAIEIQLDRLSREAGVQLLKALGVTGSEFRKTSDVGDGLNDLEQVVETVKGHALTLALLGAYLRDAHAGDVRRHDRVRLQDADAEEQGGHAFRVLDAYIQWLLRDGDRGRRAVALFSLLGFFDRPAPAACLAALWAPPIIEGLTEAVVGLDEERRNIALSRLESARLVTVRRDRTGTIRWVDTHPLIREYLAMRIATKSDETDSLSEGAVVVPNNGTNAFLRGHRRLYEFLKNESREGEQPTLEALQPLYQAVSHGCLAGLHESACKDVFYDRIRQRSKAYSTLSLGALGSDLSAIRSFFESPWDRPAAGLTLASKAWVLNEAAVVLGGLGRLNEALGAIRAAVAMGVEQRDWQAAARRASTQSQFELCMGDIAASEAAAALCVEYSELAGVKALQCVGYADRGDAAHQAGKLDEAKGLFRRAEAIQEATDPQHPTLFSVRGFQYCDLLLEKPERQAWLSAIGSTGVSAKEMRSLVRMCRHVVERAVRTLGWQATNGSLLDTGLAYLAVARAELCLVAISPDASDRLSAAETAVEQAVSTLRSAGHLQMVARGLLTRAWQRAVAGKRTGVESAQSDLDEALDIAVRGPMALCLTDIYLYRVWLFGHIDQREDTNGYPWRSPSDDLATADDLIERCGFRRRRPYLEAVKLSRARPTGEG